MKHNLVQIVKGNGTPIKSETVDRNALCKCGSGKKSKKCCGSKTKYFYETPHTR